MTHHTDAERAAYERELIDNHYYVPSDFFFKDGFYGGDDDYIQFGWDLWQAARRAPAAPVPQGWKLVPVESTEAMARAFRADDAPGYFCMTTLRCADFSERYAAMLAAAPQPPEAAPVQLPEYGIDTANHAGIRVRGYTEQQVRQLLAAHGIAQKGGG